MRIPLLGLATLCAFAVSVAAPGSSLVLVAQSTVAEQLAPLDAFVTAELARTGAPGATVVVTQGDRVILSKGYGVANIETRASVTEETLFQIGSVTKPFTAAAILSAVGDGRLALDATASSLVSGLTPCIGRATIAQLLSHSGGLIDEPDEFGPQGEDGLAAYPRTWTSEYCLLEPGRAFSYSNSGYALAGLALQEREQKPFADLVRARVLEPLGMTRTTFRPTEAMTWPLAVGHRSQNGVTTVVRPLPNDARLWPAGSLYTNGPDMSRLLLALANRGRIGDQQVLSDAAVRAMTTAQTPVPTTGGSYGYGVFIDQYRGVRRISHGGGMTGYGAVFAVLPDRRLGVSVLANGDGALLTGVGTRALDLMLAATAPAASPATEARSFALDPVWLDRYTGVFTNPRRFTVEIIRRGDTLLLRRFGRDLPLRPVGPDRFAVEGASGADEIIAAGLSRDGRADYIQMNVWALARVTR